MINTQVFMRRLTKAVDLGLAAAAGEYASTMRAVLAVPGPAPSRPGEAPHRQTGNLQGAVGVDAGPGVAVAGITDRGQWPKAMNLARGTTMEPRPFVPPTLALGKRAALQAFQRGASRATT